MSEIQIRALLNKDFLDLVNLYVNLKDVAYEYKNDIYLTTVSLVEDTLRRNFLAVGLFFEDSLVGFITGYEYDKNDFIISGIFVKEQNRKNLKLLLDNFLSKVKKLGYKTYRAFCYSDNVISIMKKYLSKKVNVQYQGDL